jgi:DNA helicase-2/ATP-dependent DNA helicase PcrA
MIDLLKELNSEQRKAVETVEGPVLILAGAGSGKTKALTHRIAFIVENGLARPEEILAVTFTNKAAREMRERIAHLVGNSIKIPWVGTFHSICVRILRRDAQNIGLSNSFTIYDPDDQRSVITQVYQRLSIDKKSINPKAALGMISSAKNELIDADGFANFAKGYFQEQVVPIYKEYQKILNENEALDFDDILMKTVVLFKKSPKTLDKYQTLFKFIHIDEYQDTNHAQYIFAKLLAEKNKNICVVGDDDQSIYSWRGANIKNILSFEKDYPNTKIIKLEQNYRSTKKILDASHSIIKNNRSRKDKKLWTENKDGENILVYNAMDEKDEAFFVAERVEEIINSGKSPEVIAILYRVNAQSRILEEIFLKAQIKYRIVGTVSFYERKEIKDILAYLKIIYNPSDNISLKRIINIPTRGIGAKTFRDLEETASREDRSIIEYLIANENLLKPALAQFIDVYKNITDESHESDIYDLINYILDKTGYMKMLEADKEENQDRIENLKELLTIASEFKGSDPQDGLEAFLERTLLYQAQDDINNENDEERITLMTLHTAKGLEFEYVFIVGLEEGIFPHSRSYTDIKEMEEERRLAYVGITRAMEKLFLSFADSRMFFGSVQRNSISRFVEDIPEELIDNYSFSKFYEDNLESKGFSKVREEESFQSGSTIELRKGLRIKHPVFGIGNVIDFDESTVEIDFGRPHGVKELMLDFAKIEPA